MREEELKQLVRQLHDEKENLTDVVDNYKGKFVGLERRV